ncbi:LrgB family protein [Sedimentibacter sp.]|uniref:LrgB family protein n=1 Tax=Sedimentibacter sp. TaxID=1960295 RepID=UPI0028A90AFE|nr:LrgB family protein [Sedimentibacter sp.]
MREVINNSVYFGVVISLISYIIGLMVKKKFKYSILNPLLVAIIIVILILTIFKIDYETYNQGGRYLSFLLTPATVCLAIPLYQQLDLLKKNFKAIMAGILTGSLSNLIVIFALSLMFKFTHEVYASLLPKSITTAIGLAVSGEIGGIPTITVAAISVTGISGNVIGEAVCKLFRIKNPISVGIALGTASHAIGTARALELGEVQGAMSSLSIAVAGLITVVLAPVFANFSL